jgi:hypothetical protein
MPRTLPHLSRENETARSNPVSGGDAAAGPGSVLRVMVMNQMMVVGVALVMVMRGGSEGWAGKDHQEEGSSKKFLHGKNVTRGQRQR